MELSVLKFSYHIRQYAVDDGRQYDRIEGRFSFGTQEDVDKFLKIAAVMRSMLEPSPPEPLTATPEIRAE